jgi:SAM-dependent methyltransferase
VPDKSTWGAEEPLLLQAIEDNVSGTPWLNLAAGDGRFNTKLLNYCDEVVAADIDEKALAKLVRCTPANLSERLKTDKFDLTRTFPYPQSFFAGCFCTAAIHTFHPAQVKFAISEIIRVVVPGGRIILDFRTDLKRLLSDGSLYLYEGECAYSANEGRTLLEKCFHEQNYDVVQFELEPRLTKIGTVSYSFSAECLLLTCQVTKSSDRSG